MYLEIVTAEAILYSSEVTSVSVPGINGRFQMLNDHAPVVSLLGSGNIEIEANISSVKENYTDRFTQNDSKINLSINSGTLEIKDNKIIILAD